MSQRQEFRLQLSGAMATWHVTAGSATELLRLCHRPLEPHNAPRRCHDHPRLAHQSKTPDRHHNRARCKSSFPSISVPLQLCSLPWTSSGPSCPEVRTKFHQPFRNFHDSEAPRGLTCEVEQLESGARLLAEGTMSRMAKVSEGKVQH